MPIRKTHSRLKSRRKLKVASNEEHDYRAALAGIKPVGDFEPEVKVVLYGRAGTGKTTLAASFPKPLLLLDFKEKGTDSIRNVKGVYVLRIENLQTVEDIYWALRKQSPELAKICGGKLPKSIALDTLSQMQRLVEKQIADDQGIELEGGVQFATFTRQDWGKISSKMKETITNYRDLDLNVVFIAHDRVFGGDSDEGEADEGRIEPNVGPALSPSVASTLNAAVGIIGNTFIREKHIATGVFKRGQAKKTKRVVQYCLRVGPHAYYTTKIRKPKDIEVPAVIEDPSYDELLEYIEGEPS